MACLCAYSVCGVGARHPLVDRDHRRARQVRGGQGSDPARDGGGEHRVTLRLETDAHAAGVQGLRMRRRCGRGSALPRRPLPAVRDGHDRGGPGAGDRNHPENGEF